jgi:hypothetical protein
MTGRTPLRDSLVQNWNGGCVSNTLLMATPSFCSLVSVISSTHGVEISWEFANLGAPGLPAALSENVARYSEATSTKRIALPQSVCFYEGLHPDSYWRVYKQRIIVDGNRTVAMKANPFVVAAFKITLPQRLAIPKLELVVQFVMIAKQILIARFLGQGSDLFFTLFEDLAFGIFSFKLTSIIPKVTPS